jgi:uncharacterized protein YkwD
MSLREGSRDDGFVLTLTRRLSPLLLALALLAPQAVPAAATTQADVSDPVLTQAGLDLVTQTNSQRTSRGLIALRQDPDLMAIARARADVMAATDVLSHTEPNGQSVFDRLSAAGVGWSAAAEIITWNTYSASTTVHQAISSWMASSSHRAIMLSTNYNYVGFGAAVSASGKHYYAGVFVKQRDETGAWTKLGSVSRKYVDAKRVRITMHWAGADTRLQVLTAGFRYFQVQARRTGYAWEEWGITTATSRAVTWTRGGSYDIRVRARDKVGNWGIWKQIHITP